MQIFQAITFSILFSVIGAIFFGVEGLLFGGALGLVAGNVYELRQRISNSESRISKLESLLNSALGLTPTPTLANKKVEVAAISEVDKPEHSDSITAYPSTQKEIAPQILEENTKLPKNPSLIEQGLDYAKRYFTEGNLIVRIGVIVLFFGVSFLVKYSIDNSLVPIEIRLTLIFLAGMLMLGIGWYLRNKNAVYGLIVQGGAIAINILTIFASFKLYGLISAGFAFPLLILFSALSMALAVLQNSRSLAVIGITGGFAAPIMASTGEGSHIALFSYYTILNLSIFFTAWFKSWRLLNLIGFVFTFFIGTIWGITQYTPEHFASTEPFLVIFFLLYVAIAILFSHKQSPELKGYIDGTLIFGTPIVAFGLQSVLVKDIEFGISFSSMVLGIFYLCTARALWNHKNENYRLICEALLAIGIIFATLTIPLALDGRWTAASWAIEGAGFVWIGLRQNRQLVKYFGVAIQLLGGIIFIYQYPYIENSKSFINSEFLGCLIVAIAALFSSYQIEKHDETNTVSKIFSISFSVFGLLWWLGAGFSQMHGQLTSIWEINKQVFFLGTSGFLALLLNMKYRWKVSPALPWLPLIPAIFFQLVSIDEGNIFSEYGFIAWPLFFASIYTHLHHNRKKINSIYYPDAMHIVFSLMILILLYFQTQFFIQQFNLSTIWQVSSAGIILIIGILLVDAQVFWPSQLFVKSYHQIIVPIILLSMLLWGVSNNVLTLIKTQEIPFIPLLNPVDIVQAIMLLSAIKWFKNNHHKLILKFNSLQVWSVLGGILFLWFNVLMFKTIHLINGVNYNATSLFNSNTVQMSVSISWTILGLAVMVFASRKNIRRLWFFGAGLTGIIVLKLFLIDLSGQGTIERIVSFLSVGALLLVVGYFSPIPPDKKPETINT